MSVRLEVELPETEHFGAVLRLKVGAQPTPVLLRTTRNPYSPWAVYHETVPGDGRSVVITAPVPPDTSCPAVLSRMWADFSTDGTAVFRTDVCRVDICVRGCEIAVKLHYII
jgi:hypothetical protein